MESFDFGQFWLYLPTALCESMGEEKTRFRVRRVRRISKRGDGKKKKKKRREVVSVKCIVNYPTAKIIIGMAGC